MSTFKARQRPAHQTLRIVAGNCLDDARVATLHGRKSCRRSVGLSVILPAVELLERVYSRKDELRSKPARQPAQNARACTWPKIGYRAAALSQARPPELGM